MSPFIFYHKNSRNGNNIIIRENDNTVVDEIFKDFFANSAFPSALVMEFSVYKLPFRSTSYTQVSWRS